VNFAPGSRPVLTVNLTGKCGSLQVLAESLNQESGHVQSPRESSALTHYGIWWLITGCCAVALMTVLALLAPGVLGSNQNRGLCGCYHTMLHMTRRGEGWSTRTLAST
jgi:hypothetical protein